jgi:chromosome segregation ATPase
MEFQSKKRQEETHDQRNVMVDKLQTALEHYEKEVNSREREISEKNGELRRLRSHAGRCDDSEKMRRDLDSKENTLDSLLHLLAKRESTIATLEGDVEAKFRSIKNLTNNVDQLRSLVVEKDCKIERLMVAQPKSDVQDREADGRPTKVGR